MVIVVLLRAARRSKTGFCGCIFQLGQSEECQAIYGHAWPLCGRPLEASGVGPGVEVQSNGRVHGPAGLGRRPRPQASAEGLSHYKHVWG